MKVLNWTTSTLMFIIGVFGWLIYDEQPSNIFMFYYVTMLFWCLIDEIKEKRKD